MAEAFNNLEECRQILETQQEMICKYKPDTTLTFVNRAYCEMAGRSREELVGKRVLDIFPEENHDVIRKNISKLGQENEKNSYEYPIKMPDGRMRFHEWSQHAFFDEEGELKEILAVGRDITERVEARDRLEEALDYRNSILEVIPDIIIHYDSEGKYLDIMTSQEDKLISPKEELLGRRIEEVFPAEEGQRFKEKIQMALNTCEIQTLEYCIPTPAGEKWFEARITSLNDEEVISLIIDITERKNQEKELELSQFALDMAPVGIFLVSPEGVFDYVNQEAAEMLDYSREELTGRKISDINPDFPEKRRAERFERVKRGKADKIIEVELETSGGERFPAEVMRSYIGYKDYEYELTFVRSIVERKKWERQLKYKTFHDELTGLYNRTFLTQEMERLDTARQLPISVIMIDVNGLKIINDTFGHKKGDEILQKAADILTSVTRDEDVLARYGGDEFLLFLPQTDNKIAHDIYERIERKCEEIQEDDFPLSLGMGIATKTEPDEDINDIIKEADDNMLQDKLVNNKSRKNRLVKGLLDTLGAKSDETRDHALRLKRLAQKLGKEVGVSNSELNRLALLATLHDIGKTTIPGRILTKPGDLTENEWYQIKKHPEKGYMIASASDEFAVIAEEVLSHHEHWDGSGYPRGLEGEEIPFLARIISIVDAYDVMTSGRPYKKAVKKEKALKEIKENAGSQFDPELARAFIDIMRDDDE
ncbi:PAS domain S-box protein [Halarsenatibacter silvermanii]|uniref:PAS domain S-box-containing protein/diguanylate cyclase (GGDEF) domain-containing protein n=1 Tax=Halarsenatibacter silvermanii TaxID=321763 RepID=A0A1G9HPP2_9FIRM|nr:PAS domain S-box protein [Halarsenatibacter silvermanii]SDL14967.1 PAS domain S-box-containing protein/diguanylate cyclase (GGDEF) domain-containing protein [Halarsenatibacter silvermanii]